MKILDRLEEWIIATLMGAATLVVIVAVVDRYLFGLLAGAVFTGIVGTLGASFVWEIGHTDQTSADMEMPMWIVYLAVPLGSYLMCFRFLQVLVAFVRTGELPKHDHSHVEGLAEETAAAEKGVHA